jgi:hypothetical protein
MFGPLKEALGGLRFDDDEQVENFLRKWLQTRRPSFYDTTPNPLAKMRRESWKLYRKVRIFLCCKIVSIKN